MPNSGSCLFQPSLWEKLLKHLQPPDGGCRVLNLELGNSEVFGCGPVKVNPWVNPNELYAASGGICADELTSLGLPLSLALALERNVMPEDMHVAMLRMLLALAQASFAACDQLNSHRKMPLKFRSPVSSQISVLALQAERLCKEQLAKAGHLVACEDWTRFGGIYELWICRDAKVKAKVRLLGMPPDTGALDLAGVHTTGARVWAGSVILARWMASLCLAGNSSFSGLRLVLGPGPVLELGSGLGLAGIILAKLGFRVVLSDREPVVLDRLQQNIDGNDVQDKCRVLSLDWARAGEKRLKRQLKAQHFSVVMGGDIIYSEDHVNWIVPLLQDALPFGGLALFVSAKHYRPGIQSFVFQLRLAGHEVFEASIPVQNELQNVICGSFEPNQEYLAIAVRVSASVDNKEELR